mmetsp:Transcript_7719/g.21968  ORF Transcript_7719/g.21968 Transcript_7719/m.21968 type:complete len:206 (+) Transcript_7719:2575-3192(+)
MTPCPRSPTWGYASGCWRSRARLTVQCREAAADGRPRSSSCRSFLPQARVRKKIGRHVPSTSSPWAAFSTTSSPAASTPSDRSASSGMATSSEAAQTCRHSPTCRCCSTSSAACSRGCRRRGRRCKRCWPILPGGLRSGRSLSWWTSATVWSLRIGSWHHQSERSSTAWRLSPRLPLRELATGRTWWTNCCWTTWAASASTILAL